MLSIHHIHKTYGIQPILQDISFSISNTERIGLIGPNGSGKTTLMRILAGFEQPDSGIVTSTRLGQNLRVGYLAQGMDLEPGQTLQSTLGLASVSQAELEAEIASAALALAANPNDSHIQNIYDSLLRQFSNSESSPAAILGHLGLANFPLDTLVQHLSGGQKTRLMLARVLLDEPHLLLLDEPTNHLDIEMLEWLEAWLNRFQGAALIVSHDRAFLDNTVTSILELDPATHQTKSYPGNYADYLEQKLTEREKQTQDFQDQQDELAQLRSAAMHIRGLTKMKKGGKSDSGDKFAKGFFGNRATKNVAGRAKHIEARIEKILTEEKIERPKQNWQMKLDFGAPAHQSKDVLITEKLSVGYDVPLLTDLNLSIRAGQRIALTGPNGTGKTTLIRTIAGRLPPLAGSLKLGATVKLGYMTQEQELLNPELNALQTVQSMAPFNETEARNFLHYFLLKETMRCVEQQRYHLVSVPDCNLDFSSHKVVHSCCSMNRSTISISPRAPASRKPLPISKGLSLQSCMTATSSNASPPTGGMYEMEKLKNGRLAPAAIYRDIKMKISPTPYTDINEILESVLIHAREILQEQFVGMYLFGSLANGDFDEYSDIDVLIVTEREISDDKFSALQELHAGINKIDSPWAIQVEASYIPRQALRRFDHADKLHPHMDRGRDETLHRMSHESDWIIQRHILRERGIVIVGPDLQTLIDPISPDELRRAVADVLPFWAEVVENPSNVQSRGYQSFFVLSLCRMLYTLRTGRILSKAAAAKWALEHLDPKWKPLIERALIGRQNPGLDIPSDDLLDTLEMMRLTIQETKPTPYQDVNAILRLLLIGAKAILKDQFVGMYLYGSLSSGDFNSETSDIDFLFVTENALSTETITELESMHHQTWASSHKRAGELEGAYVPKELIHHHDPNGASCPTINEGKFYLAPLGSDWIIQRYIVREYGVVIEGPEPKTLIDYVSPNDIRGAVMGIFREWWFPMLEDASWLSNNHRGYHSFAILSMCRALHALEHGTIVSKPVAARWAKETLDERWSSVIDLALLAQKPHPAEFELLPDALELIQYTKDITSS